MLLLALASDVRVPHNDLATIYCMSPAKWFNFYYDILYESSTLI